MKISVITPSIRPKGLWITQESLARQTMQDFEWLVEIGIPGKGHDFNRACNRMLRRAKGELIVSLQDYIKVPEDYLAKFWQAYVDNPDTFFTAPVGKTDDPEYKTSDIKWDWRAYADAKMQWNMWEIDSGAAPLSALKRIGGFDEELDKYWSSDNVNVGYRAHAHGYKFKNVVDNPALAYDHDKFIKHPFRENFKPDYNNERMREFDMGLRLTYLDDIIEVKVRRSE